MRVLPLLIFTSASLLAQNSGGRGGRLATPTALSRLLGTLREETNPDQAVRDVRTIWETDRWFTFPKFEETAKNVAAIMRRAGLEDVEIGNPPADGVTQGGFWTMPLAWDVKTGTLEILDPQRARRPADAGRLSEGSHVDRHVERPDARRRSGHRGRAGARQPGRRGPEGQAGAGRSAARRRRWRRQARSA